MTFAQAPDVWQPQHTDRVLDVLFGAYGGAGLLLIAAFLLVWRWLGTRKKGD